MAGFDEWSPGTDESVMEVPSAETSPSPEALDTREPHERPPSVPRATTTSGRVDKSQRKLNHNISEKKRQRTISQYIDELRSLIPTCDETYITKTTILQRCVTHVSHLKHELAIVRAENARLVQALQSAMTYTTPDGAAPIIGSFCCHFMILCAYVLLFSRPEPHLCAHDSPRRRPDRGSAPPRS